MTDGERAEEGADAGPKPPVKAAGSPKRKRYFGLIAALILVIAAVLAVRAYSYVRREQAFCAGSCHAPKDGAPAWHTAGHDTEPCQSCHETPARVGYALLWKKITGDKNLPKHSAATVSACTDCHEKNPVEWRLVEATEGHRTHRGAKDVNCFSCHGETAHSKEGQTEKLCFKCHEADRLHKVTLDAESCLSCHTFNPGAHRVGQPRAMACSGCHADESKVSAAAVKVVEETSIHGGLDCKLCHEPHNKLPPPSAGKVMCARCHHIDTGAAPGKPERKGHQDCTGCHEPHAQHKHALDSCVRCHESRVKGLSAGLTGLAALKGLPFATKTASSALRHESCASCHLPHTWTASPTGCVDCHKDKAESIAAKSPPQHNDCKNCHDVHGPPPTVLVCMKCHGDTKQSHLVNAPGRHKDCLGCHDPHAATKDAARDSCAGCHTQALAQFAMGPKEHAKRSCIGCHKPHNDPRPSADTCATCHTDQSKLVATAEPPKHKACASCHQPHKFVARDIAATCSNCHDQTILASTQGGAAAAPPHGGECKSCHSIHGPAQIQKKACFQCHKPIEAAFKVPSGPAAEPHGKCRSCHTPHRPAAQAAAACGTCHTRQKTVAASWPSGSPHAAACQGCHTPHDVKGGKKACAECHKEEASSALGGKHQCTQCHAPHQQTPGKGPAWWARCSDCHDKQVTGARTRGPVHSDCKNCHQPHKFEVPSCTSCHATAKEKALHAVKGHADKCDACHDPHQKSEPSRAQCLSCHTNKQNHEPEAQKCQACHPFR